ncbi:nucleolar complex-associated protein 3 [Rhodotorula diobovata]|uniref:Nucleolar complex-associated protein 3 n=1 Tax=Rhodotorula diobovata TaxID=5288 RepID=A0A5C5FP36_9BASI|nr:nucleolar complex-associated protein 3 [Rhodotorula diobovata]
MPDKKRPTSAKQSAHSKRHKASGGGSKAKKGGAYPSATDAAADRAAKAAKSLAKKDRKGKGPAFIPVPEARGAGGEDSSSGEGSEEDEGMDVDPELLEGEGVDFLTKLDKKGMSASRPTLAKAYKDDKPAPAPRTKSAYAHIKVDPAPPTKSELKAAKKRDIERKKRLKARENGDEPYDSADDLDDDAGGAEQGKVGGGSGGKLHPDGELVDDLESDDFAFGSGDDDDLDELSSMSEWSDEGDAPEIDTGDDSLEDDSLLGSEDDEEGLWSDEDDDEGEGEAEGADASLAFDSNEELGGDLDSEDDDDESSEDEEEASEEDAGASDDDDDEELTRAAKRGKKRAPSSDVDDVEARYEASRPLKKVKEPRALPTKLPVIVNGKVVRSAEPLSNVPIAASDSEGDNDEDEAKPRKEQEYRSDPLGQRFGRPAVRALLEIRNKKERVTRAREEIADLGREAAGTGEGEGGLNLLKRLLSLCAPKFNSSSAARSAGEKPIQVDREIRIMAMVSLLAVFIDILPGYRIRELSEAEKDVQVSQMVARQREWENGLVSTYKKFLEICEHEVAENSPVAPAALHCLCTCVREKPDFNFATNVMDVIVKRLGRKGWDEGHQQALDAVIYLFQNDTTTTAFNSLHLVRLISRLVRARSFAVRPEVISALLNLRLKDELGRGTRASADAVFREREGKNGVVRWNKEKNHRGRKGGKAKEAMAKKGSKKARQARKEQNQVDREMREAEGEINQEERERNMTETLKLLFALYFRIVKLDYRSPLLPAALEGLARFAHLVNIDFFRDLLECLKGLIYRGVNADDAEDSDDDDVVDSINVKRNDMREKLLCIVTAFELLQGQGEALNIDLGDFVTALYSLILPLSLSPTFEEAPYLAQNAMTLAHKQTYKLAQTEADLVFRALSAIFLLPRSLPSPIRTLAFAKRLLSASLHWPPASQLRTLSFLRSLLIREPRLEAMLETSDRRIDGRWRGHVDEPERAEPESTCFFEASLYVRSHPDDKVRAEAKKLVNYRRE